MYFELCFKRQDVLLNSKQWLADTEQQQEYTAQIRNNCETMCSKFVRNKKR